MEPQDINPGFLTPTAVKALRSLMEAVRYNTQRLDQLTGQSEIDVPAKLTAYDADTEAYSWVEQWYDSDGSRVDYEGGRSGGPSYMPAYAVGNGIAPEDWEFPIEVRLRPRINTAQGVIYEFPWNCSCNDGGSRSGSIPGSGSSGSGSASGSTYLVPNECCDVDLPSVLYGAFTGTGFGPVNLTLTYDGVSYWVSEEYTIASCGVTVKVRVGCVERVPGFGYTFDFSIINPVDNSSYGVGTQVIYGCDPFVSAGPLTSSSLLALGCPETYGLTVVSDEP